MCVDQEHYKHLPTNHSNKKKPAKSTNYVEESETEYDMHTLSKKDSQPYLLEIELNSVPVQMEIDTGAAVSVISESTYSDIQKRSFCPPLQPVDSKLRTYTGHHIEVLGITPIKVRYEKKELYLSIHVVKGSGPNLLGRDWLAIDYSDSVQRLLDKHPTVFNEELGCLKGTKVKLNVFPDAQPKFYRARTVPLIHKEKVERELQKKGIISPVQFSSWAAPVVPVLMRLIKLPLLTPIPFPSSRKFLLTFPGTLFSKLDLANAFLQLPLDDTSKQYLTINLHKGLFQYNRLPFGVASAPSIFQRHIDSCFRE